MPEKRKVNNLNIFKFVNALFYGIFNTAIFKIFKVSYGENLKIRGKLYLRGEGISIGTGVKINSGKEFNTIGGDTRTILKTIDGGRIEIGDNAGISNSALLARKLIKIGQYAFIGGGVKIYDNDFHSLNFLDREMRVDADVSSKAIIVGNHVFVGAHSIILKGVTIGNYSIIGAGSIVTKDVPANELWAGNPAKFIRKIDN